MKTHAAMTAGECTKKPEDRKDYVQLCSQKGLFERMGNPSAMGKYKCASASFLLAFSNLS